MASPVPSFSHSANRKLQSENGLIAISHLLTIKCAQVNLSAFYCFDDSACNLKKSTKPKEITTASINYSAGQFDKESAKVKKEKEAAIGNIDLINLLHS